MSQMTQFLWYYFRWLLGQGRVPAAGEKEHQNRDGSYLKAIPLHQLCFELSESLWDKSLSVSVSLPVKWRLAHPGGVL